MKLSNFVFEYPPELVAKYPAEPRDSSRLMVLDRKTQTIEHRTFSDLPDYFNAGDVMVVNNTKVFPARLYGNKEKTGARIEVFLLRELNAESRLWDVIVDPARKIRIGNKLYFENELVAEVIDNTTSRGRTIRFVFDGNNEDLYRMIDEIGQTPIPPYLKRKAEPEDQGRYQTMFAEERGAVAAPTAGLHFTPALLRQLHEKGVSGMQVNYAHEDTPGWPTYTAEPELFSDAWWAVWKTVADACSRRGMGIGLSGYTIDWPNGKSLVSRLIYSDPEIQGREITITDKHRFDPPLLTDELCSGVFWDFIIAVNNFSSV